MVAYTFGAFLLGAVTAYVCIVTGYQLAKRDQDDKDDDSVEIDPEVFKRVVKMSHTHEDDADVKLNEMIDTNKKESN